MYLNSENENILDVSVDEKMIEMCQKTIFMGLGIRNSDIYSKYLKFLNFISYNVFLNNISNGKNVTIQEMKEHIKENTQAFIRDNNLSCRIDDIPYFYNDCLCLCAYFIKSYKSGKDIL